MFIFGNGDTRQVLLDSKYPFSHASSLWYRNSSSKMFSWGRQNEDSKQLAFALLLHFCGVEDAHACYLDFYKDIIRKLKKDLFVLRSEDIILYANWRKAQNAKSRWKKLYWRLVIRLFCITSFYDMLYPSKLAIEIEFLKKQRKIFEKKAKKISQKGKVGLSLS